MRFALLEIKFILAKVLKKYNVNPTQNVTQTPLEIKEGFPIRKPRKSISVLINKRDV